MKRRIRVLVAILQDRQTPWYERLLAGVVVAYAASPIDLIPDFIPVLGYLDDLILIPLGVWLVFAVTPQAVRVRAARRVVSGQAGGAGRHGRVGAIAVVAIWIVAGAWFVTLLIGMA